jgi:RNA-directed DNA polymerase
VVRFLSTRQADLEPNAYGYRPKRSAKDAIREVHKLLKTSYSDVVDADLSKYFDTIPHDELLKSVARRIVDRNMLHLIKMWLKAPVVERDKNGKQRITGGRNNPSGTPQGGVVSPLLANLYMNRFLKHWRKTGKGGLWQAHIISYADDFVILSRGHAQEAREWTRGVMQRLGLTLNEAKTSIKDARREKFDFLGYSFGPHCYRKKGTWYRGASPSKKSQQRIKAKVDELLQAHLTSPWAAIRTRLNQTLRGWAAYFSYGTRTMAYRAVDNHVYESVRHFLRRRHKVPTRGTRQFSGETIFGRLGVVRLRDIQYDVRP